MPYQIKWTNKETGTSKVSPKQYDSLDNARVAADELNREYPKFDNVVVEVIGDGKPPVEVVPPAPVFKPLTDTDPFPFGIHQGKPMLQVPSNYLDWIDGQKWISDWPAVKDYIARTRPAIHMDLRDQGLL